MRTPRLFMTPGEPAGIGPELMVRLAQEPCLGERVVVADPELMQARAKRLALPLTLREFVPEQPARAQAAGELTILPVALNVASIPGRLAVENAAYVLQTLGVAAEHALSGVADALITGPVHKGIINEAGVAFSGHTEFFAERAGVAHVVMMLAVGELRVALATTHLPLRAVADAITDRRLEQVLRILHADLRSQFGRASPRIVVLGLNPHAGEGGHLGREEIEVIEPLLARLRAEGFDLLGPLPADTAFTPSSLAGVDAVLAMYHDQGLPVLKYAGFGRAVNITLGLPFIRTSVDHGTALSLAGTGRADAGSLAEALALALTLAARRVASGVSL